MKPVKLIITNKSNLQWKYGKNFSKLLAILKQTQVADKKKGLDTIFAFVDDTTFLRKSGIKKMTSNLPKEYKRIVDDLYNKYVPAYIVILGAQDIIPFQDLENPAVDEDQMVASDLPYACDTPFSTNISNFTGPTRVVGRIPDIMGEQPDISFLQRVLTNSIQHKPLPAEDYTKYFAMSAWVWMKSTELSLRNMFGESKKMILSPKGKVSRKYKLFTKAQLEPLTHFYNCHGAEFDLSYYGQKGDDFPVAVESSNLSKNIRPGTIVAAECCYGAQLFDSVQVGINGLGIASNYLANDAVAFLGSSTIAYGPADSQGLADLITQYFIKNILKGASAGRAFLEARQQFLTEAAPDLDPLELKTLGQFYLLGDPSIQPADCEEAEVAKLSVGTAIVNTRKNLSMKGASLEESISITEKLDVKDSAQAKVPKPKNQPVSVQEILDKNNFTRADKSAVYQVKPKSKHTKGLQKKFGGTDVKFHTYIQNPKERIKKIRILVVKENSAQILGWRVYDSR